MMKSEKIAMFVAVLFTMTIRLFISHDTENSGDLIWGIFKNMGLDIKENLSRQDIKIVLRRLLNDSFTEEYEEDSRFFEDLSEKFISGIPETFPRSEISIYLSQDILVKIFQDVVKEKFGEDYINEINPIIDEEHDNEEIFEQNLNRIKLDNIQDDKEIEPNENFSDDFKQDL